jgi:hypothetical protein
VRILADAGEHAFSPHGCSWFFAFSAVFWGGASLMEEISLLLRPIQIGLASQVEQYEQYETEPCSSETESEKIFKDYSRNFPGSAGRPAFGPGTRRRYLAQ